VYAVTIADAELEIDDALGRLVHLLSGTPR
jgi:hypothetical protein